MPMLFEDHPLVGKAFARKSNSLIDVVEDLSRDMIAAGVGRHTFLLGEVHDNPFHHEMQRALLAAVTGTNPRAGAIVYEMIDVSQQAALDAVLASAPKPARGTMAQNSLHGVSTKLEEALQWRGRWPDWGMYEPLFATAFSEGMKILAGDASRADFTSVAKGGLAALGEERMKALALDQPLPPAEQSVLIDEMYESHCRLAPRERLATMADAQRFRDAHLADRLLAHPGPRVLIAGNGHTRRSAVPRYLKARGVPEDQIVSVVMVEVKEGVTDPLALLPRDANGDVDADFVIFTPAVKREGDPCDDMRRAMERKAK
ncbi:MAG: ChaN family lipoprotein [Hyphomicrobiales bacterium]|nr:ChaN family lipoprotein [Hyphomicrobiales bacterium]